MPQPTVFDFQFLDPLNSLYVAAVVFNFLSRFELIDTCIHILRPHNMLRARHYLATHVDDCLLYWIDRLMRHETNHGDQNSEAWPYDGPRGFGAFIKLNGKSRKRRSHFVAQAANAGIDFSGERIYLFTDAVNFSFEKFDFNADSALLSLSERLIPCHRLRILATFSNPRLAK